MINDMSSRPVDKNIEDLTRELKHLADKKDMSIETYIESIMPL